MHCSKKNSLRCKFCEYFYVHPRRNSYTPNYIANTEWWRRLRRIWTWVKESQNLGRHYFEKICHDIRWFQEFFWSFHFYKFLYFFLFFFLNFQWYFWIFGGFFDFIFLHFWKLFLNFFITLSPTLHHGHLFNNTCSWTPTPPGTWTSAPRPTQG